MSTAWKRRSRKRFFQLFFFFSKKKKSPKQEGYFSSKEVIERIRSSTLPFGNHEECCNIWRGSHLPCLTGAPIWHTTDSDAALCPRGHYSFDSRHLARGHQVSYFGKYSCIESIMVVGYARYEILEYCLFVRSDPLLIDPYLFLFKRLVTEELYHRSRITRRTLRYTKCSVSHGGTNTRSIDLQCTCTNQNLIGRRMLLSSVETETKSNTNDRSSAPAVGRFDYGRCHFHRIHDPRKLGKRHHDKLERMGLASLDSRSIAHFAFDIHFRPRWSIVAECSAAQRFVSF